jgi:hypothetical protein
MTTSRVILATNLNKMITCLNDNWMRNELKGWDVKVVGSYVTAIVNLIKKTIR